MTNQDRSSTAPTRPPDDPAGTEPEPSDQSLLKRYVNQRDEAAFAALVQRYGPLVLGVCRRVLGHEQDSEDAFQATFLVLARKAGVITKGASMGGWLYRVAYRIARKLKGRQARRHMRERAAEEFTAAEETPAWVWHEVGAVLDEEVNRLPEKYRLPFILCYLNGKTNEEAARRLACPVGTVASRLAWARERLRVRLTHRGVVLSAALLAGGLAVHAGPPSLPSTLAEATVQTGVRFGAGQALTAEGVAVYLAREYLRRVWRGKLILGIAGVFVLVIVMVLVVWHPWLRPGAADNGQRAGNRLVVEAQQDLAKFQGTWKVDEVEFHADKLPTDGIKMTFTDHNGRLDLLGGVQPLQLTFELVPSEKPKLINVVLLINQREVPAPGIYELDGDTLRLCYCTAGDRPKEFATHPNTNEILYLLRRE